MRYSLALLTLGFAALLAQFHCTSKSCTEMGCGSGARIQTEFTASEADLTDLVVTACRNDTCASGPFVTTPSCPANVVCGPPSVSCSLTGAPWICFAGREPAHAFDVSLDISFDDEKGKASLKDGDVYTLRVAKPGSSTAVVDLRKTATYTNTFPNGEDCDGPDGYCRSAALH